MSNAWHTVIIGAGPAGLAAALQLGAEALVLDKAESPGGLSSSIEFNGAIFDLGGHSFHTPHPSVKQFVYESLPMFEQKRDARCYTYGTLIRYPFQKHFGDIPLQHVVQDCRAGLVPGAEATEASNLDEYLRAKFGEGISRHFLIPYNQKLWGADLTRIAPAWVQERIAGSSDGSRMPQGKRTPLEDASIVAYPTKGGFGEIWKALAQRVRHLRLNETVVSIDQERRLLRTASGATIRWHNLISTVPLDQLARLLHNPPDPLTKAVGELESIPLAFVMVALQRQLETSIQRIYCADSTSPAHKIVLNHNSSDYLRSLPNHGIMGEISLSNGMKTANELEREFVLGLIKMGLITDSGDVKGVKTIETRYGYPVKKSSTSKTVSSIKQCLSRWNIQTVGRFGEWDYINSDEALWRGLNVGRALAEQNVCAHVQTVML